MSKMFNYEAEQIHEMVHPDLLTDTTHYVAECKEIILNEVTPNYPKLTEYEKEWLYFAENVYQDGEPVNLEYQAVNIDGYESVKNVIPFHYKEAILKGQTLVNSVGKTNHFVKLSETYYYCDTDGYVKPNTKYWYKIKNLPNNCQFCLSNGSNSAEVFFQYSDRGESGIIETSDVIQTLNIRLWIYDTSANNANVDLLNNIQLLFIEYQEGMENWNIPYFEGMQSVKMPVLKTTGKNLFDGKLEPGRYTTSWGVPFVDNTTVRTVNKIKVKPSTTYTVTVVNAVLFNVSQYNDNNYIGPIERHSSIVTFTTSATTNNIHLSFRSTNLELKVQLEESSTNTPYEPYQSNLLTVNEEVTLRGVGDVMDELDLLTGEMTQRIGEIVLNGSDDENWKIGTNSVGEIVFNGSAPNIAKAPSNAVSVMKCHEIPVVSIGDTWSGKALVGIAQASNGNYIQLKLSSRYLSNQTVEGLIEYLSQNPITLQYQLATESISTVDLSTIIRPYEGTNHYYITSNIIPPRCTLSIPVESTGAQTLMEITQGD